MVVWIASSSARAVAIAAALRPCVAGTVLVGGTSAAAVPVAAFAGAAFAPVGAAVFTPGDFGAVPVGVDAAAPLLLSTDATGGTVAMSPVLSFANAK